jgi:chemotaxis protein CheD
VIALDNAAARTGGYRLLLPGEVGCGTRGDVIETLLGSCIAIVLTDPWRTVGGMCHYVHTGSVHPARPCDAALGALAELYRGLRALGADPRRCIAYVYGGGNMFPDVYAGAGDVGDRNARWALDFLADEGIAVVASEIGGARYRRVYWCIGTAEPCVRTSKVEPLPDRA